MKKSDFYYELPQELIAQEPVQIRDRSRLMVLNKENGNIIHRTFADIYDYIEENDCLVLNNTRVIPARLFGKKEDTGGKIEFVLLHRISKDTWEVILKPGRRAKVGAKFVFGDGLLTAKIVDIVAGGNRIVEFSYEGIFEEVLYKVGQIPLPHYITKELEDVERYQTVYSKEEGSAAAPTAGLHFTNELLKKLRDKGVSIAYVTLHVGLGTFRPVKAENINEHKMHSEYYQVNEETSETINKCKKNGGRIIAIGTTSCRTLESITDESGLVKPGTGWTDIFIYPGYKFKIIDAMITNFHLPESTLLMLISAFATREYVLNAYEEAVKEKYRFFSLGDAMYIY